MTKFLIEGQGDERREPTVTLSLRREGDGSVTLRANDGRFTKNLLTIEATGIRRCAYARVDGMAFDADERIRDVTRT